MSTLASRLSPQLRIAVTPICNLHCFFCRPEGEGIRGASNDELTRDEISLLVSVAEEVGFSSVKYTGGEPLLRKDILDIVSDTVLCDGITDIQLVTNGTTLAQYARGLRESGLSSLTVSLDAATPNIFQIIRGGDIKTVLQGLDAARSVGLPVRINSVINRHNLNEIPGLISVARQFGTSLKLLDMINLTEPEGREAWLNEFVPFSEVRVLLTNLGATYEGLEPTPGGIGAPLLVYGLPDGIKIVIKDSLYGLYFSPSCHLCSRYPCQDAIISLRVTHDGRLKKCLIREDNLIPIREDLIANNRESVRRALTDIFVDMTASEFIKGIWKPPTTIKGEA